MSSRIVEARGVAKKTPQQSVKLPYKVWRMAQLIAAYENANIGDVVAEAALPAFEAKMKAYKLPRPKDEDGKEVDDGD